MTSIENDVSPKSCTALPGDNTPLSLCVFTNRSDEVTRRVVAAAESVTELVLFAVCAACSITNPISHFCIG